MDTFVFDVTGPKRDQWTWKRVDAAGKVIEVSSGTFPYYLDCVEDAKGHGFAGEPSFPKGDKGRTSPRPG